MSEHTDDGLRFDGVQIVYDPVFDDMDGDLPANTCYVIPPEAAREIERASAVLGRNLTADEVISVLIHRSAKLILAEER